jgi:hypothetical protein
MDKWRISIWFTRHWFPMSVLFATFLAFVSIYPIYIVWSIQDKYQFARVCAASLSVIVTVFAFAFALIQYHTNSINKKIERSMSFWQRSNNVEVGEDMREFIKFWIKCDKDCTKDEVKINEAFLGLIGNAGNKEVETCIENLLDFYDEACSAVIMGACDEDAMFFYLGPLMIYHWKRLKVFITVWLDSHPRPEKWGCFINIIPNWQHCYDNGKLPSGKSLPYPVPHRSE